MTYPIEKKLVIAVASSALFDLTDSDKIYREQGVEQYAQYQETNEDVLLKKGVAFPFIRRFLHINEVYAGQGPVEVVLLSRNSPETGMRVHRSIKEYGLDITRSVFLSGKSPFDYMPAFNAALFLSANEVDVRSAIEAGHPAGMVLPSTIEDTDDDIELRVAFDFDGVIADDEAESVYHETGEVDAFNNHEIQKADIPHNPGPLGELFCKLSALQQLDRAREREEPGYQGIIKTAIVTARGSNTQERLVTTLKEWGVSVDEIFFLAGMEKKRILEIFKPNIYFDDQIRHLEPVSGFVPSVHIPFGIKNIKNK